MKGYGAWVAAGAVLAAAPLIFLAARRDGPSALPRIVTAEVRQALYGQPASPAVQPSFTVDLFPAQPALPVAPSAGSAAPAILLTPVSLDLQPPDDDESIYSEAPPVKPGEGINEGGVNNDLTLTYFNHYIYRGVDHSITANTGTANSQKSKADSLNLKINDRLEFNLGNWPHPFFGIFANVYDADPKSRFQEIRPFYGADLTLRPLSFEGGGNSYFYPKREGHDTAEVYGKITLDDSGFFNSDQPFLSPYIYAAYDYHRSNGWYFEAGVSHQIPLEDFGVTLNFQGDAAYILGYNQQFVFNDSAHDSGFQHYDAGVTATYSLTRLLSIPPNYGDFNLVGYFFYTGKLNSALRADNVVWGGVGIEFKY